MGRNNENIGTLCDFSPTPVTKSELNISYYTFIPIRLYSSQAMIIRYKAFYVSSLGIEKLNLAMAGGAEGWLSPQSKWR